MAWVGTSGWSYDHWDGVLYPPGTPPARRLDLYTREFDTVELNASHYRWPRDATFASWRRRLPDGFRMSVKAPRGLTHAKKLYSPEVWVDRIAASWHELRERRAVLLVQLPPTLERDDARLGWFLGRLPWWVPVAVELRHPSWHHEEVFALLERHRAAYCVMSGAGLPCVLRATAPFVYVRLHGPVPRLALRRLVLRRRAVLVGRPDPGVGGIGTRGLRVLQQRRGRPRGAERPAAARAAQPLTPPVSSASISSRPGRSSGSTTSPVRT